jgi:hypothetical protein
MTTAAPPAVTATTTVSMAALNLDHIRREREIYRSRTHASGKG